VFNPDDANAVQHKHLSDEHLKNAAGYFEKARLIEPEDLNLLNTLRAIYARQQSPKYDEIDAIIKRVSGNE
jgi:hypothetical protein